MTNTHFQRIRDNSASFIPQIHVRNNLLKERYLAIDLLVKAMVFPVVMYECESWTIKKGEHQRIDAFELWCWRRVLRAPWTARRSNQSILKKSVLNIHWKD